MELRVLNYFLMVAREENITKAAQLLHVTQPTLSRQLMQLEEELGVKLFDRSSHSIILTGEGMLLKRRAQEMLTLAEKAKAELKQDIVYGDGIGYPYDAADALAYLPRLCRRYMPEGVNIGTWNINSLEIRAARATAQKSKKIKKDRGDSR